jgi:hypothetical protein
MEILHTLKPQEAVKFLDEFYAQHRGKYELSSGEAADDLVERQTEQPATQSDTQGDALMEETARSS